MCSRQSLPFVVSAIYWAQLGEIEPLYQLKTTITQHQCPTQPVARTLRTLAVLYDSLYPHSPSMKMIAWNCQGAGSVTFRTHAYELHRRHRPDILIIIEPRIAKGGAQAVIDTLPYTHSRRVILRVSLEEFGCYGMRAPPSVWKFSFIATIVCMLL